MLRVQGCARVHDADGVETAGLVPQAAGREIRARRRDKMPALGRGQAFRRRDHAVPRPGADFNKDKRVAVQTDQIQFMPSAPPVAGHFTQAGTAQKIGCGLLSGPGKRLSVLSVALSAVARTVRTGTARRKLRERIGASRAL